MYCHQFFFFHLDCEWDKLRFIKWIDTMFCLHIYYCYSFFSIILVIRLSLWCGAMDPGPLWLPVASFSQVDCPFDFPEWALITGLDFEDLSFIGCTIGLCRLSELSLDCESSDLRHLKGPFHWQTFEARIRAESWSIQSKDIAKALDPLALCNGTLLYYYVYMDV